MSTTRMRLARTSSAAALVVALGSGSLAAVQLLSVSDEIELGREAQQELQRALPEIRDPLVRTYVAELGARLVVHASGAAYPYSFNTADSRDLNAFALPGGPVWIHRGILERADDESHVAGVLAHEIAHVSGRHAARQLTKEMWTAGVLMVIGALARVEDDWRAAAIDVAARATAGAVLLKFSRNDERAADREAVRILRAAGYDARGLLEFLQVIDGEQGRTPGAVVQFFSTHPAPRDRVRDLERVVLATETGTGRRGTTAFTDMQRRLSRLAPPPRSAPP